MRKLDLKKIVEAMKPVKSVKKSEVKELVKPSGPRIRDMRQEAMEMGSHGAKEFFSDSEVSNQ